MSPEWKHFENQRERWRHLDRTAVWHAFSSMSDYDGLLIQSAQGCWLTDIDGREYLDGASSLWCNIHGHRHPRIDQAIRDQLDQVAHVTNLGMSHPVTIELAETLVKLAPRGLNHVFFCGDGASAVEVAMKIAFQYWQQSTPSIKKRTKFLALGSAYHGDTIGTVALGGVPKFHDLFRPLLFDVLRGPCPNRETQPVSGTELSNEQLCEFYLEGYRSLMEQHADSIAAVVVEPLLQCAAGMVRHPDGFLKGMRSLCNQFDTLLIADEIAVGMGRTGKMFACEHESVEPDLLCIGKGLTGGYLPMSATLVTTRIFECFLGDPSKTLYHGHTYGGNPLAAAAANATLRLTQARLEQSEFFARILQLQEGLKKLSARDDVRSTSQLGLMGSIELKPEYAVQASQLCKRILSKGVWLRPLGNCVPIVPPLVIAEHELQLLLDSLEYGLDPVGKVL